MLIVFESRQDAEVRNPEVYLGIEVFLTIIFFTEISVATWACTLDLRLHPKIKQRHEDVVAENPAVGKEGGGGKKPSPRAGDADGSERTLQRRKSHSITTQVIEKRNWRARLLFLVSHPPLCGVLGLHQPSAALSFGPSYCWRMPHLRPFSSPCCRAGPCTALMCPLLLK